MLYKELTIGYLLSACSVQGMETMASYILPEVLKFIVMPCETKDSGGLSSKSA